MHTLEFHLVYTLEQQAQFLLWMTTNQNISHFISNEETGIQRRV